MARLRIDLNSRAIRQLLTEDVRPILRDMGQSVADAANSEIGNPEGFIVDETAGRSRARVAVITATGEAMHAEATRRTLTRAVEAARR